MAVYKSGETVRFTFQFFIEDSTTTLEDQDSVQFRVIRDSDNTTVYEDDTLTSSSTGTYVVYYEMPFNYLNERLKYKYKVFGLKGTIQTVQGESFYVE